MIYWVLNITLLLLLAFVCFHTINEDFSKWIFAGGLFLKCSAGIIVGLIFIDQYKSGDSLKFFELATELLARKKASIFSLWFDGSSGMGLENEPRVFFFVKILSFFFLITGGSYWLSALYFSFVSFLASWYFIIEFVKIYPKHKVVTIISFLVMPSLVFWSSGILKGTIANAALVVLIGCVLKIYHHKKLTLVEFFIALLCGFVLLKIKHYLLVVFLLFSGMLLCIWVYHKFRSRLRWLFSTAILLISLSLTQFIHPYLTISRIPLTIYENNLAIANKTDSDAQLDIVIDNPDWISVIKEIPTALYTGLFRPSLFDSTPIWGIVHKIENLILLGLVMLTFLIAIKTRPRINWSIIIPSVVCISVLASILALSTPNLGSLVRYKNAFMPFLFLIAGILPYQHLTSGKN